MGGNKRENYGLSWVERMVVGFEVRFGCFYRLDHGVSLRAEEHTDRLGAIRAR
jgi:hypothetical protein